MLPSNMLLCRRLMLLIYLRAWIYKACNRDLDSWGTAYRYSHGMKRSAFVGGLEGSLGNNVFAFLGLDMSSPECLAKAYETKERFRTWRWMKQVQIM